MNDDNLEVKVDSRRRSVLSYCYNKKKNKTTSCYFNTQKSNQEHDVVRCLGHERASAENLQEPGTEGPAGGMKRIAPRCMLRKGLTSQQIGEF